MEDTDYDVGIIGPFTIDQNIIDDTPQLPTVGGVPFFAGKVFAERRFRVQIHAPYSLHDEKQIFREIECENIEEIFHLPAEKTLTFFNKTNSTNPNDRIQEAVYGNGVIYAKDMNAAIEDCEIILLAPLTDQDIPSETLDFLLEKEEDQVIAVAAQGFIRKLSQPITYHSWNPPPNTFPRIDILSMDATESYYVANIQDISLEGYLSNQNNLFITTKKLLDEGVGTVLITRGSQGSIIGSDQGIATIPSFPIHTPVNLIGAGDIFTAAYLSKTDSDLSRKDRAMFASTYVSDYFNARQ